MGQPRPERGGNLRESMLVVEALDGSGTVDFTSATVQIDGRNSVDESRHVANNARRQIESCGGVCAPVSADVHTVDKDILNRGGAFEKEKKTPVRLVLGYMKAPAIPAGRFVR